jgi:leucyl aminopeptidase
MIKFDFKIRQKQHAATPDQIDKQKCWIVLFPESAVSARGRQDRFVHLDMLVARQGLPQAMKAGSEVYVTDLPNTLGSRVAYACILPDLKSFELLTLARKLVAVHKGARSGSIALDVSAFSSRQRQRLCEAIVAAAAATSVAMPSFKSKVKDTLLLRQLEIYGHVEDDGYRRTLAEAEGNALCRYLSILPPNRLTPTEYLATIKALSKQHGWKLEFLNIAALKQKQAGAFLAVAQGSPVADAGIVRLRYTPAKKGAPKSGLALVGKGICYDTGGTNLKPAKFMYGMHEDMQGSAVVLGVLLALTRLKVDFPVECWLALAMNHIGPLAYKPNDVVTAADGTTIEIIHTDAEGRMVLADTLIFASEQKPSLLIDYATLTGACVYSVGTAYSGVFTNQHGAISKLIKAGVDSGERVWPFPLDEDYDESLKSDIADVKQCALEGNADHIMAARFLQRFVKHDTPWVHVDLSSSRNKGGLAHIPTDTTGFGIRYTLNLLFDNKIGSL